MNVQTMAVLFEEYEQEKRREAKRKSREYFKARVINLANRRKARDLARALKRGLLCDY